MTRRFCSILFLMLCMTGASATSTSGYLRIDGRYYDIDAVADSVRYNTDTFLWTIKASGLFNCRRPNGQPSNVGAQGIVLLPNYETVYTSTTIQMTFNPFVISITTPTGDVACGGSVGTPIPTTETPIFANGFD